MPIYEYQCAGCGHRLEVLQKMSDAPLADCPSCGRSALQKMISAAGFRLKGGGWYETDFKRRDKKNVVQAESPEASKSDSKPKDTASCGAGACPACSNH